MTEVDRQDTDRLRLNPERRLRAWEQAARPIADLVDEPFDVLGRELSRSVLVHPNQPLDGIGSLVERLDAALPITPEHRARVADACNALGCVGVEVPSARYKLAYWLPGLTAVEPPFPGRLSGGFAALAIGDWFTASHVAPQPYDFPGGGQEFPGNVLALLGYTISLVRRKGALAALWPGLYRVADELDLLCSMNQLDEATALWIARFALHTFGGSPLGEVATRAHDWLWSAPARLEVLRTQAVEFPIGATFGDGAYRIEHRLKGTGSKRLYRGIELATGAQLLIAFDVFRRKHDIGELRATLDFDAPGLFSLVHVGHLDGRTDYWIVAERVTPGTWLPTLVGPADPWTAPRKAIELGVSAGRILLGAYDALGDALSYVRPEVMWGEQRDGRYVVTGLSPRVFGLFVRSYEDAMTHPLFVHQYRDPSRKEPGYTFDDRSLTFSLAVMVTEWTIGVYPLLQTWGNETADRIGIEAPEPLRALLERGLSPTVADRPSLAAFVDELEKIRLP